MTTFPKYPEDLDAGCLTQLIGELHPRTEVADVRIIEAKGFGSTNVSTSSRVMLDIAYANNPAGLPSRTMAKMVKTDDWPARGIVADAGARQRPPRSSLYANEIDFYRHLGGDTEINTPRALAAALDVASGRYVLLLEDLVSDGAHFYTQYDQLALDEAHALLAMLASFHAQYWQSDRFGADLRWLQTPADGPVADMIMGAVREGVRDELRKFKFKRELLERVAITEAELFAGLAALHRHQGTLPATLIHGDAHLGNSFRLRDGNVGLYDWQLVARGFCLHDVAYMIVTSHSIAERRKRERDLLRFYREALLRNGVHDVPDEEKMWLEYRRAIHWCVTIGWLPCPPDAYGWELVVIANARTFAAYEDLETKSAIRQLF